MMDDLQQAYSAYQQALVNLQNPKVNNCHLTLMRGVTKLSPAGTKALVWNRYSI